ncbi:DUF4136 domain-containing protein [Sphingomicrobium sp. XHP0239]|uniref:DUF4136 domain-containing protein n=1 Tax=Sphingomicrobium maritimum TaxID=3133972 RepID=UPI0031CCAA7C
MRTLIKAAVASTALLGLTGCATSGFPAQVSRFQAMPAPTGESFYIVPMDSENEGGLEFSRYAAMVASEMAEEGYVAAPSRDAATMLVEVGYGVDDGRQRIVGDRFGPRFGVGLGYSRLGYGGYYPFYRRSLFSRHRYYGPRLGFAFGWDDPFWYGRGIRSYDEYRSRLEVDIRRTADNQAIFEGTALARSRTDNLGTLVPNLIEAMFTDFPGRNGETVKITVRDEDDDRRR